MLEGYLYEIVSREESSAVIRLLPSSPIFKAHFPTFPITPGVTLVQMALELMGKQLLSAKDIKFVGPVLPTGDGPELRYEWSFKEGGRADVNLYLMDGTLCAKMVLGV